MLAREILKEQRLKKGLLQKDIAKTTHTSCNAVSYYETGGRKIPVDQLSNFAEALGGVLLLHFPDTKETYRVKG